MPTTPFSRAQLMAAVLAVPFAIQPSPATAKVWVGGSGNWNVPSNWSPPSLPTAGEAVHIVHADGVARTVTYNVAAPSLGLLTVDLTGPGAAVSTLSLPNNLNLAANGILIGGYNGNTSVQTAGRGAAAQAGGTVSTNPGWDFVLGHGPGSIGAYSLSGTGALVANQSQYVGLYGTGTFNHSAGTNTIASTTGFFEIGTYAGSTGTYNLSGTASLVVNSNEYVGDIGTGSFNQTGGTHTVAAAKALTLGNAASGTGSYSLSGAASLSSASLRVGYGGAGSFTQSAGSHSTGSIIIAFLTGSTGAYALSGGSLNSTSVDLANSGPATFDQTGGTHSVADNILISRFAAGTGTYSLSAGSLSANGLYVAGSGSAAVLHSGGNATFNTLQFSTGGVPIDLAPVGTGTYSLSGAASLTVNSTEIIGSRGRASFTQTGGTHSVGGSLSLGTPSTAAAAGSYALSAGSLSVASNLYVGGSDAGPAAAASSLTITGGAASVAGTLKVYNSPGTLLTLTGGTLSVTSAASLDLSGNPALLNWGPNGTLSLASGYTVAPNFSLAGQSGPNLTLPGTLASPAPSSNLGTITLAGGGIAGPGAFTNHTLLCGYGTLSAPTTNLGTIAPAAGPITLSSTLTNSATLDLNSSLLTGPGSVTNAPDGLVTGPGTLSVSSFSNAGLLVAPAGTTRITPAFTNAGVVELASPAANLAGGTITNTGTLQGHGKVNNPLVNSSGTLEPTGGTLTLAGPLTNATSARIRIAAGTKLLVTGAFPTGAGSILLTGGTLDTNNQPHTNSGTISVAGGTSTLAVPLTNSAGSKVVVSGASSAIFTSPVTNLPGSEFRVSTGSTAVFLAPVTGPGQFTGPGSKHFESGASSPSFLATNGSTTVLQAASLTTSYLRESSLSASGPVSLTPDSPTSLLNSLMISGPGSLDLANNRLVLTPPQAQDVNPGLTQLRQYLSNSQFFSSTAHADPQHRLAIAYIDNALLNATTWGALPVGPTSILTRLTYLGDANLDGLLTPDDYALLDRSYARSLANAHWTDGDFNYDGTIDNQDYFLIDRTALSQSPTPSPDLLALRAAQFGDAYVQQLLTAIPEPSALACLFATLPPMLRRRR